MERHIICQHDCYCPVTHSRPDGSDNGLSCLHKHLQRGGNYCVGQNYSGQNWVTPSIFSRTMNEPIIKVVSALSLSSLAALLESFQAFEGVVQTLGLPLLCVAGFAYAIVKLYQTILKLVTEKVNDANARMADAQVYATKLEVHVEKGAESRAKLIELSEKSLELNAEQLKAQARMAISMDNLTREIRLCQQTHVQQ